MLHSRCRSALVTFLLCSPALALAGEPNCDTFITSAPYVISAPGHYCLANDVSYNATEGAAIWINSSAVVLDLRGYRVSGRLFLADSTALGIVASDRTNIVIRNGQVRRFFVGISITGSQNMVEDIRADDNPNAGIYVAFGFNNTVRNCIVSNTGGPNGSAFNAGLWLAATQTLALNNVVAGTRPAGSGSAYGIVLGDDGRAINNQVFGDHTTDDSITDSCFLLDPTALHKDNIASGCRAAYSGGIPAGTNYP